MTKKNKIQDLNRPLFKEGPLLLRFQDRQLFGEFLPIDFIDSYFFESVGLNCAQRAVCTFIYNDFS